MLVVSAFFVVGFLGALVPLAPGSLVVWLGIVVYRLWLGEAGVPWWFVFASGGLVILAQLFDIASGAWGAKKFGATWRGMVGALLGGIVGFFVPPPLLWLLLGPIIGAVLGEMLGGRKFAEAGRAGLGTVVGALAAWAAKIGVTVFVIGWFYYLTW
jgi:hypothetical protein